MTNPDALQEKQMEFQYLLQHYKQLQEHFQQLQKHNHELHQLIHSLNTVSSVEGGSETLLPLGSGICVKGNISSVKDVIVNVGMNIAVTKSLEKTISSVDAQHEEVESILGQMEEEIKNLTEQLISLQKELQ